MAGQAPRDEELVMAHLVGELAAVAAQLGKIADAATSATTTTRRQR